MSFEHGFFDELEKIAEGPALKVVGPGRIERAAQEAMKRRIPLSKEVAGPHSPLTTRAAYRAGLSTGRRQMKEAVKGLKAKAPFYTNPLAAAALGAGGLYLGSRLLRSRRDEE